MQLLFAVARSDNKNIEVTYLNDAGETQSKVVPYGAEAAALQALVQAAVGAIPLRGVQIFTEHANAEHGETRIEALYVEAQAEGGASSAVMSVADAGDTPDEVKATNAAMRTARGALRTAIEAAL